MKTELLYIQGRSPFPLLRVVQGIKVFGLVHVVPNANPNGLQVNLKDLASCCKRCCEVLTCDDGEEFSLNCLVKILNDVISEQNLTKRSPGVIVNLDFILAQVGENSVQIVQRGDCAGIVIKRNMTFITIPDHNNSFAQNRIKVMQDETVLNQHASFQFNPFHQTNLYAGGYQQLYNDKVYQRTTIQKPELSFSRKETEVIMFTYSKYQYEAASVILDFTDE